jgi:hypothetical protein
VTKVVENARLELLRSQVETQDALTRAVEQGHLSRWDGWSPLHEDFAQNSPEDFRLAARECAALGHLELHTDDEGDMYVKITPQGYDWIRAHDLIGETAQESA